MLPLEVRIPQSEPPPLHSSKGKGGKHGKSGEYLEFRGVAGSLLDAVSMTITQVYALPSVSFPPCISWLTAVVGRFRDRRELA